MRLLAAKNMSWLRWELRASMFPNPFAVSIVKLTASLPKSDSLNWKSRSSSVFKACSMAMSRPVS